MPPLLIVEIFSFVLLVLLLGITVKHVEEFQTLRRWERAFNRAARRRGLSVVLVFFFATALRLALLPSCGIPRPQIHDEFSYLLAGDTFASGRIINPTHPLWQHFETFHVLQQPTYVSKYPPAQGLVLALGQKLGHPWIGVLLSVAGMCAAITWMLQGWVPPGWALFGGLLIALRFATVNYWVNSYWGGAVAAIGGALMVGAVGRILRRRRWWDALLVGFGIAVLANSRPYEGLALCVAITIGIAATPEGRGALSNLFRWQALLPLASVLTVVALATGYYNWRATGQPLHMPYMLYAEQYDPVPIFWWQAPKELPSYDHAPMRRFYAESFYWRAGGMRGALYYTAAKLAYYWAFFLGPALSAALFAFGKVIHDRRTRVLLIALPIMTLALLPSTWRLPHYAAPLTALLYVLVIQAIRHMRQYPPRGSVAGLVLVAFIPLVFVAPRLPAMWQGLTFIQRYDSFAWYGQQMDRTPVIDRLQKMGGRHLVIVRYSPEHNPDYEWVYNRADIDRAPIVWAREMDADRNRELIEHWRDRRIWLLEPDRSSAVLNAYQVSNGSGAQGR